MMSQPSSFRAQRLARKLICVGLILCSRSCLRDTFRVGIDGHGQRVGGWVRRVGGSAR